ncbi:MAG TPA: hypothetical protein VJX67_14375, partial [Blastocatellia bacterium]|nr:hypothetical protein [Blastocatellia bacterium]
MANSLPLCSPKTRYPRKHTFKYLCASLLIAMAPDFSLAHQDGKLSPSEILDETARNGERVVAALKQYSYYSELTVQSVKLDGVLAGEYDRFEKIYPDKNGGTGVHVIEQKSTMPEEIFISSGAIENMSSLYRFILTPDLVRQYDFNYIGRERIDEIDSLVFDVRPKGKVRWREGVSERYLKGRIWIDE